MLVTAADADARTACAEHSQTRARALGAAAAEAAGPLTLFPLPTIQALGSHTSTFDLGVAFGALVEVKVEEEVLGDLHALTLVDQTSSRIGDFT
jgi:hypothetical protein